MRSMPMIDPHKLMNALVTSIGIDIPEQRVRDYWRVHRHELKEDWATSSPATDSHIPCALYGDSAKISDDGTKVIGLFISLPAVWKPQSSRCARWCVFAMEEHKLFGHHTLNAVFRRLTYSCNILFDGIDPDHPERLLCNGRKFTVTELKGDWQWLKIQMRFQSSWQNLKSVCFLCNSKGRSDVPGELHYCMDETPAWRCYDLTSFLANQMTLPDPCFLTTQQILFLYFSFLFWFSTNGVDFIQIKGL